MEQLAQVRQKIAAVMKKRDRLLHVMMNNKQYIAAQVYERYKKCGNKNCKCQKGELHGPFLWIYQNKKGKKLISTTVAAGKESKARQLAENYSKWLEYRRLIREMERQIQQYLDELELLLEQDATDYVTRRKPGRPKKAEAEL